MLLPGVTRTLLSRYAGSDPTGRPADWKRPDQAVARACRVACQWVDFRAVSTADVMDERLIRLSAT